ncbi:MAG: DUF2953 domain-containing protein [Fidelibacterota bacterium]
MGVFLLIIVCPVRIRLQGILSVQDSQVSKTLRLFFGYKNRGIGVHMLPAGSITFGLYRKPFFIKSLDLKPIKFKFPEDNENLLKKIPQKNLIKPILKTIHLEESSITGHLGLSNPMYTGIIMGYIHAVFGIVKLKKFECLIKPVFSPVMNTDIKGDMHIRFSPVFTTIQAVLSYLKFRKIKGMP